MSADILKKAIEVGDSLVPQRLDRYGGGNCAPGLLGIFGVQQSFRIAVLPGKRFSQVVM